MAFDKDGRELFLVIFPNNSHIVMTNIRRYEAKAPKPKVKHQKHVMTFFLALYLF